MTLRGKISAAVIAVAVSAVATPQPAAADSLFENNNPFLYALSPLNPFFFATGAWMDRAAPSNPSSGQAPAAAPTVAQAATFHLANYGATLEAGEQTFGGLMTRTVWGAFPPAPQASRVVIHTVGSNEFEPDAPADLDTLLAAHRGSTLASLALVAFNDDRSVPTYGSKQSLIQFDAAANTPYRIQMGSKANAEGDVYANVFVFPPGGGISAWLATYGGSQFEGRDYICLLGSGGYSACPWAKFVLHNSTNQTLKVYPSNSSGAFLTPAPVTLTAGAIATVNFFPNPSFDDVTPRTLAGYFAFAGYAGTTLVTAAHVRSLVVVKANGANVLSSGVFQQVRAGRINEPLTFQIWIKNSGAQPAVGCHARSSLYSRLKTVWQRFDPGTGAPIGALREPATIPAGQAYWFNVTVASQESRLASPYNNGEIILDCANTTPVLLTDRSRFDLTALGLYDPADIVATIAPPTGTFINVPAGSYAAFNVRAFNQGSAGTIVAFPHYVWPYTDTDPNARFTTLVCQTASISGACLAAPAQSVQFASAVNSTKTFRVFVRGPSVNPGFDPDNRRVFVDFKQNPPAGFSNALVGTVSIAVRRS